MEEEGVGFQVRGIGCSKVEWSLVSSFRFCNEPCPPEPALFSRVLMLQASQVAGGKKSIRSEESSRACSRA